MAIRKTKNKVSKVMVGNFGSEMHTVLVQKTDKVSEAFSKADMTLNEEDEILDLKGNNVKSSDVVRDGETYYLTKKYTSAGF